ncbi:glutamyl-tRNAGlu reductase, N-terminal domain protein [Chlamydia ibidis]|uniref:Glutamyl-tRNA reductase n=2 Tax=Chlamydia ibidis TaxID=1405396 RepID=S7KF73_9CHLA|nr:glutamyl-tRNA reductase [Chlamydia ibidis]EPP34811.1 glutamyl-tRNAGlu reductase, N-terminal domain protein [Chlamydia ibidis]EQM63000.1 glutamyl-tRNAGlu reductase, N-terminal domain protein [Chlamydia ibidis 10-1398/6]
MILGVVGVSYREAALQEREAVINLLEDFENQPDLVQRFFGDNGSFVLLLTCHRAEIYYFADSFINPQTELISRIASLGTCPYAYQELDCFAHLFAVTSGVDSLIFGETEIQGQVKRAYMRSQAMRNLPFSLHFLFQKALKVGKDFRSQTTWCYSSVTMEAVVQEMLVDYKKSTHDKLLFIGYSDINRKIAAGLKSHGYKNITFCSRCEIHTPYHTIKRHQLSFRDPYDVIFFGSAEVAEDFVDLSLRSLASIPNRLVFDFNVPRTFTFTESSNGLICLDMDFISERVQKKLQCSRLSGNKESPFLTLAAKKQWEVYEKKCSHMYLEQVAASQPKLLIL